MSAISLGRYTMFLALLTCIYGLVVSALAGMRSDFRLQRSANRSIFAMGGLVFLASCYLWYLLQQSNYEVQYIWQYTDSTLSKFLKFSAFWAGQKGSLLLWSLMLCFYSMAFAWKERNFLNDRLSCYATTVVFGVNLFFLGMLNTVSHPFERHEVIPVEGNGLNPLLQHWAMVIHPPTLFLGYVGFAIPFAYGMGSLLSGQLGNEWLKRSRLFSMVPWTALTLGIILGGKWAYEELGWGGYWAWDPVENASFIPWLIGTAYIHSVMITERRPMLKVWNYSLVSMTFLTCILGTYLTRSGVLQSVHSFGFSPLGNFFLAFLAFATLFTFTVILGRLDDLRSERKLESVFSREAAFLANNLLFLSFAFIVLVGTVAPAFVKYFSGQEISIREPFFNAFALPFGFAILILTGIGPLISWRSSNIQNFRKNFLGPLVVGVTSLPFIVAIGIRKPLVALFWASCVFVLGTIWVEIDRGARANMKRYGIGWMLGVVTLINRNRRRYGGYVVHLGIVIILIGISASSAYQIERDVKLSKGETFKVGYALKDFSLTYKDINFVEHKKMEAAIATVQVQPSAGSSRTLSPEKQVFAKSQQPHTQVETISTFFEDFYIILTGFDEAGGANFKIYINPLVNWIWFGAVVILLGSAIAMTPRVRAIPEHA